MVIRRNKRENAERLPKKQLNDFLDYTAKLTKEQLTDLVLHLKSRNGMLENIIDEKSLPFIWSVVEQIAKKGIKLDRNSAYALIGPDSFDEAGKLVSYGKIKGSSPALNNLLKYHFNGRDIIDRPYNEMFRVSEEDKINFKSAKRQEFSLNVLDGKEKYSSMHGTMYPFLARDEKRKITEHIGTLVVFEYNPTSS